MEDIRSNIMESIRSQMAQLYFTEVYFINTIQKAFIGQDKLFVSSWISLFGETQFVYFILFSVFVGLRYNSGMKFLGAICFSEWLNFILKIFLQGERPYWWIKTQDPTHKLPYLSQTSMVCKSDPGNPSRFLQINTVIWYVLIATFNNEVIENSGFGSTSKILLRRNIWKLYGVYLIFLFISEVVSISNFPHQSIFGVVCGIFVLNRTFVKSPWMTWSPIRLFFLAGLLIVSCFFAVEKASLLTGRSGPGPFLLLRNGAIARNSYSLKDIPCYELFKWEVHLWP
ncbi:glucose-6-phosphatase 3 isoform X3 [Lepeophtheirus salmonis]|uniref:glucose-6-phosphatase 3 isoform X3 n=1 Tax=Lepeophtheirus salmonis TaxID=72036 RepID=UPI001AE5F939|nr:glucose-6-phosphatase 2-like isoform X3 [Lepeophtheirus salmonis]